MAELITTGLGGSGTFEINSLELKLKNKLIFQYKMQNLFQI